MKKYDVIIIGGGPSGVSAALYLLRSNKNVLIITDGKSTLKKAHEIENFYGSGKISGESLYKRGLTQARRLGCDIVKDEAYSVFMEVDLSFNVVCKSDKYYANKVIMATGVARNAPKEFNIDEFEGKGVSYCAVCDAFFYRKRDVFVLGNTNYAYHEARELNNVCNSVTILTNGKDIEFENYLNFAVSTKKIQGLIGNERLERVVFTDNTELSGSGLFVALGTSSLDLAKKIGVYSEDNKIVVNDNMETNIKGIYAVGDTVKGKMQIAKAVYDGMIAAMAIIASGK